MTTASPCSTTTPEQAQTKALAEPFAFAVLLWPAVVGVGLLAGEEESHLLRYGLYAWVAIMHLAAYGGRRGAGFGNVMLFNSAVVVMACYAHPSPWSLAWLPVLLIGLHAAQRTRLNRCGIKGDGCNVDTVGMQTDAGVNGRPQEDGAHSSGT